MVEPHLLRLSTSALPFSLFLSLPLSPLEARRRRTGKRTIETPDFWHPSTHRRHRTERFTTTGFPYTSPSPNLLHSLPFIPAFPGGHIQRRPGGIHLEPGAAKNKQRRSARNEKLRATNRAGETVTGRSSSKPALPQRAKLNYTHPESSCVQRSASARLQRRLSESTR